MPNETLGFMQRLQEYGGLGYTWILIISAWAGTVRYLTSLQGRKPKMFEWLTETIVSGFVGVITAMICQYYRVDYLLTAAITGVAAHNGTRSLYLISELIKKNTKFSIEPSSGPATLNSKKED